MNLLKYSFLLIVLVSIFLPIYAQENTLELNPENKQTTLTNINDSLKKIQELLKQQTDDIVDSTIASQQIENMRMYTMIIAGIEAAMIGALVALIGQNYVMRVIEQKKIKKTKNLILDDLSRIYKNVNQMLLEIEILRSKLKTSTTIQQEIIQNHGIVKENIARILVNIRLLHWNAIVSSGYLIKLDTDSIRSLQSLNNFLEDQRNNSLNAYKIFTDHIVRFVSATPNPNVISDVTIQLNYIAEYFHLLYPRIIDKLHNIEKNVEWVEFDTKDLKKKIDVKK